MLAGIKSLNVWRGRLRQQLPAQPILCVIGSTSFNDSKTEERLWAPNCSLQVVIWKKYTLYHIYPHIKKWWLLHLIILSFISRLFLLFGDSIERQSVSQLLSPQGWGILSQKSSLEGSTRYVLETNYNEESVILLPGIAYHKSWWYLVCGVIGSIAVGHCRRGPGAELGTFAERLCPLTNEPHWCTQEEDVPISYHRIA